MGLNELITAVKAAATKDALESLVKEYLGIDLDKRKALETLRAEVLKGLGAESEAGAGTGEQGGNTELAPNTAPSAAGQITEQASEAGQAAVSLPSLEEDEAEEPEPAKAQRMLLNTENKRQFAWSPELAALPHMKEL
jgi:hypothetical protein